jgi:hypothetical protein
MLLLPKRQPIILKSTTGTAHPRTRLFWCYFYSLGVPLKLFHLRTLEFSERQGCASQIQQLPGTFYWDLPLQLTGCSEKHIDNASLYEALCAVQIAPPARSRHLRGIKMLAQCKVSTVPKSQRTPNPHLLFQKVQNADRESPLWSLCCITDYALVDHRCPR